MANDTIDLKEILRNTQELTEKAKKIENIEQRAKALEEAQRTLIADLKEVQDKVRGGSLSLPGTEDKKILAQYSLARAANAIRTNNWKDAGFEREISEQTFKHASDPVQSRIAEAQERTMSSLTGSSGGLLIPSQIQAGIAEKFTPAVIAQKLGAQTIAPSGWPYRVIKETQFPTAYMVGETGTGTASDGKFGNTDLNPKQCIAIVTLSNQQVAFSTPSTEQFIYRRIAERMAAKRDQQIFAGLGGTNELIGLLTNPAFWGLQTVAGVTTTELNLGDISKAMSKLDEADVPVDAISMAIHPFIKWEMYRTLFKQFTAQTEGGASAGGAGYIFQFPFITDAKFKEITGVSIASSSQLPITLGAGGNESWPLLGKFDEYLIAEWGGMMLESSNVATVGSNNAFAQNLLHLKVSSWFDGAPIRTDAFCYITGVVKA